MKCVRCQQGNPPQAGPKFCFECATPFSASRSGPRLASPEAYTPQHLAERMINSKAAENGGSVNRPFVVSTLQLPK